jgi:cysteine desulfuration protein SufE
MSDVASKLEKIIAEFSDLEPRERLELLLDFANNLPPLPKRLAAERDAGLNRVHECQTPVFIWVEPTDGRVQIYAYVAPEAPTVKGFVGILVDAFSGAAPNEVLNAPADLLQRLGLVEALGMVRMRGLGAILHYIRKQVEQAADSPQRHGGTEQ